MLKEDAWCMIYGWCKDEAVFFFNRNSTWFQALRKSLRCSASRSTVRCSSSEQTLRSTDPQDWRGPLWTLDGGMITGIWWYLMILHDDIWWYLNLFDDMIIPYKFWTCCIFLRMLGCRGELVWCPSGSMFEAYPCLVLDSVWRWWQPADGYGWIWVAIVALRLFPSPTLERCFTNLYDAWRIFKMVGHR